MKNILWFNQLSIKDIGLVGGKNASLGELYNNLLSKGVNLANGFATTAEAYFYFLKESGLATKIETILKDFDYHNLKSLQDKGKQVRKLILAATLPQDLQHDIVEAYK